MLKYVYKSKLVILTIQLVASFYLLGCDSYKEARNAEILLNTDSQSGVAFGQSVSQSEAETMPVVGIRDNSNNWICTGVHIGNDIVLTAAHCFKKGANPDDITVYVGKNINSDDVQKFEVKALLINGTYKGILDGVDLALLKIKGSFPENFGSAMMNNFELNSNYKTVIYGYGSNMEDKAVSDTAYKVGELNKFEKVVGPILKSETHIITKQDRTGAHCPGDSGGPMLIKGSSNWIVVGITSYTRTKPHGENKDIVTNEQYLTCGDYGNFTNVIHSFEWLIKSKYRLLNI